MSRASEVSGRDLANLRVAIVTDKGGKGNDFMGSQQFRTRKVCCLCYTVGDSNTIRLDKRASRLVHRCVDRDACLARRMEGAK